MKRTITMNTGSIQKLPARQRGMATLFVAIVLLVAATLLMIYMSRTTVVELRVSANEVRSKQAFAAAQAGVDEAIRALNGTAAIDGTFTIDLPQNLPVDSSGTFTRAVLCTNNAGAIAQNCPADRATFARAGACVAPANRTTGGAWTVSCGWSDDGTARKRIVTFLGLVNPLPGTVSNPLTAKGAVSFTGNPTVVNYFNNLTVWTGAAANGATPPGRTVVRNPSTEANALNADQVVAQVGNGNQVCNNAPNLICTSTGNKIGADIISSDTSLSNLTSDQFFENFFGVRPLEYKSGVADEVITNTSEIQTLGNGKIYFLDGDATLGAGTYGTTSDPIILVVNGNLQVNGSPKFNGLLYVSGALDYAGGADFRGAAISNGAVSGNGNGNFIFDPGILTTIRNNLSSFASAPGAWRDF